MLSSVLDTFSGAFAHWIFLSGANAPKRALHVVSEVTCHDLTNADVTHNRAA